MFSRRKQSDIKPRRKRPRHERLIIAMTLVVGAAWLVSIFRHIVFGLTSTYVVFFGGQLFVDSRVPGVALVEGLHFFEPETIGWSLQFPMHLERAFYGAAWQAWLQSWLALPLFTTLIFLPALLRTAHRRRRNRCADCGYPRDEQLEHCPECGRPASEPSPGLWLLAWRAYRWPLACIALNVAVTLVAIEVMN